jgi:Zn-finger nucleic acid-binding protein
MGKPPLTCPGCRKPMLEVACEGALVDVCSSCNGLWLDKGELEALGAKLPSHRPADAAQRRDCPRCLIPMDARDAHLAQVDICWGCGGTYLDAGEIEAFAEAGLVRAAPVREARDTDPRIEPAQLRERAASARAGMEAAAPSATDPAVPAAAPEPPSKEAPAALFFCDLCRAATPVEEKVVGELLTVCARCARRHGIRHDPALRQARVQRESAEMERDPPRAPPLGLAAVLRLLFPF